MSPSAAQQPRVYRTEALVLKGYNYGEADRILTLFTPHNGKLSAIAKGMRRTKSRMSGHLDLFTHSSLLVARGRQLDIVTQADTIESFRAVRDDLWRSTYCHYVAELLDGFTAPELPNYPLFSAAVFAFRRLGSATNLELVVRAFELQLMAVTGYRPQLHRCLHCGESIQPQTNRFSTSMGGVLCPSCSSVDHGAPPISVNALKLLRNLQTNEQATLSVPQVDDTIQREVEKLMLDYIIFRLEARPKSLRFLDRLRSDTAFA
jgi:DNA repair protein RecO (recombination protein O)